MRMILIWRRRFYHTMQLNARNFFNYFFRNLAMFVYFYDKIIGMKIFEKQKYIYTEYKPEHITNLENAEVPYQIRDEFLFFGFSIKEGYLRWSALGEIIVISTIIYTFSLK